MFKSIQLRNFLSFGPESPSIPLGPLNIVIGANGSGKSNVMEAFRLLHAAPNSIFNTLRRRMPLEDWVWKPAQSRDLARIDVEFTRSLPPPKPQRVRAKYSLAFDATPSGVIVGDELLKAAGKSRLDSFVRREAEAAALIDIDGRTTQLNRMKPGESILTQVRHAEQYPLVEATITEFEAIRLFAEPNIGLSSQLHRGQSTQLPRGELEESGLNLPMVLKRLLLNRPLKAKLESFMRAIYPQVTEIDTDVAEGSIQVVFKEGDWVMPASRLSDGTMRWLFILVALLDPEQSGLACIEEPELGLHPDAIGAVAEVLREVSESRQVLVSTHSDHLLDAFTDDPEAVLVVEKEDGQSRVERLSKKALANWLETYRLGQVWRSGEIGGNRW